MLSIGMEHARQTCAVSDKYGLFGYGRSLFTVHPTRPGLTLRAASLGRALYRSLRPFQQTSGTQTATPDSGRARRRARARAGQSAARGRRRPELEPRPGLRRRFYRAPDVAPRSDIDALGRRSDGALRFARRAGRRPRPHSDMLHRQERGQPESRPLGARRRSPRDRKSVV